MSNRRVKDIAYDEDDLYDDDEDEFADDDADGELSAEDQEQLRQGTIKVREILGTSHEASDKAIHDALWNYYYDIAKTVAHIKNTHRPIVPKQPKAPSKFDQAANLAAQTSELWTDYPFPTETLPVFFPQHNPREFEDVPWLRSPPNRLGNIHLVSPKYRGGLLGGSGKPSKLAALAAARRKKEEEKKASPTNENDSLNRNVSLLDRLSTEQAVTESRSSTSATLEAVAGNVGTKARRPFSLRPKLEQAEQSSAPVVEESLEPVTSPKQQPDPELQAPPSTFATAMFGPRLENQPPQAENKPQDPLPVHQHPIHKAFAGPSPDDVVLTAQAKGSKTNNKSSRKGGPGSSQAAAEVQPALPAVADPPRKSKNLNVLNEYAKSSQKPSTSFVVVGHVDHGKSTLMGRLLYDLKVVDQRLVDKLRREAEEIGKSSFAQAWLMDETAEERSRGVTVDFATKRFETDKTRFTILDAPGHQDFIPNMIAGASQADFAILVIDAGTNSFESGLKGQTKEHALLVRSMGVQQLIIVINKMDMASWSQQRFDEISKQISSFLLSAGFQAKNLTFIPTAGLTGENVVLPISHEVAPWYYGPTLVQALDTQNPVKRAMEAPLRMTLSDVFRSGPNNALSVTGRIEAGSLQVGDQIIIMPSGEKAAIRSLEVDDDAADWAVAGQIATLHITDMDPQHLRTGDIVCSVASPVQNVTSFTSKILAFEHIMPMFVDVHRGPLHAPAKIAQLIATLDKTSGEVVKKKPRVVQPGGVARVKVELEVPVPLEKGSRVVLRAEGRTVAAGLVE